jgi:hypothetical protein
MANEPETAYRAEAARLRALAENSPTDIGRAALLEIVEKYEALAAKANEQVPTEEQRK